MLTRATISRAGAAAGAVQKRAAGAGGRLGGRRESRSSRFGGGGPCRGGGAAWRGGGSGWSERMQRRFRTARDYPGVLAGGGLAVGELGRDRRLRRHRQPLELAEVPEALDRERTALRRGLVTLGRDVDL